MNARARGSDPDTSHAAAASVKSLTDNQRAVMVVMRMLGRPVLDEELVLEYHRRFKALKAPRQTDSGIRSRRSELSARGLLVQDEKSRMTTGRMGRTWRVAPKGDS